MTRTRFALAAGLLALGGGFMLQTSSPALALSMKECSTKYNAAKTGNTLGGQSWNDFRKAQCGDAATPAAATTAATAAPATAAPTKPVASAPAKPVAAGNVVFPSKVDPKYSTLSAGKQRFKTCNDQYDANKANGGNGELKWIQKGGGYYSQCNARLKGA
ncbi:hypothetical protein SAMN04515666_107175 [Bosea lupini]|uniref:Uncharacterized protein n=2 Tax=Bosea lupini TaxID=1036779 RepID=A0A1H7VNR8_9HYPH|nr:hypothetical protein SAMN04515666_107175 [Bosea lupini]